METISYHERQPGNQPVKVPFVEIMRMVAPKHTPSDVHPAIEVLLDEVNRQFVENHSVFHSEKFPGTAVPYSKIMVDQNLVSAIASLKPDSEKPHESPLVSRPARENAENQVIVHHPAFGVAGSSGPENPLDVALNQTIRMLPRVAGPMRTGEPVPSFDIYVMGNYKGMGGAISPSGLANLLRDGIAWEGKLYDEFIKTHIPDTATIRIQGASKGAVIADQTANEYALRTSHEPKRLYDNPAGVYVRETDWTTARKIQMAAGFFGEFIGRTLLDEISKGYAEHGKGYEATLRAVKQIPEETKAEKQFKMRALLAEADALGRGTKLDTSRRYFERRGIYDPITMSVGWMMEPWRRKVAATLDKFRYPTRKTRKQHHDALLQSHRSFTMPINTGHFFLHNTKKSYEGWTKRLRYTMNTPISSSENN